MPVLAPVIMMTLLVPSQPEVVTTSIAVELDPYDDGPFVPSMWPNIPVRLWSTVAPDVVYVFGVDEVMDDMFVLDGWDIRKRW